jgi:hypothetical protein
MWLTQLMLLSVTHYSHTPLTYSTSSSHIHDGRLQYGITQPHCSYYWHHRSSRSCVMSMPILQKVVDKRTYYYETTNMDAGEAIPPHRQWMRPCTWSISDQEKWVRWRYPVNEEGTLGGVAWRGWWGFRLDGSLILVRPLIWWRPDTHLVFSTGTGTGRKVHTIPVPTNTRVYG